jgi:hypothetical protein
MGDVFHRGNYASTLVLLTGLITAGALGAAMSLLKHVLTLGPELVLGDSTGFNELRVHALEGGVTLEEGRAGGSVGGGVG